MGDEAPPGWYPDGQGATRYWDGSAWTDRTREEESVSAVPPSEKKDGAFARLKKAAADKVAEKREEKEALERKWAEDVAAAGALVTSGTFGVSTIEIYENGYVRVDNDEEAEGPTPANVKSQIAANLSGSRVSAGTPFEKLRSISFTPAEGEQASLAAGLEGVVGPAVTGLLMGAKHVMKASAPGLAAAGIAHIAGAQARVSYLTIATDRQIHTLSNQVPSSVGLKMPKKAHVEVGLLLEAAGNATLGVQSGPGSQAESTVSASAAQSETATSPQASAPGLSERLRELAALHQEGILSDEEFASAKATLLSGL